MMGFSLAARRSFAVRIAVLLVLASLLAGRSNAQSNCLDYQNSLQLDPSLTFEYIVNLDDPSDTSEFPQGTLKARLTYQGTAWVSLGITESESGSMVPGEAIVGLPDENAVRKYDMKAKILQSVTPKSESSQTLRDVSVTQDQDITTVTFTKVLVEPEEIPINGNGRNIFLYAYGFFNQFNIHRKRGAFTVDLTPCDPSNTEKQKTGDDTGFVEIDTPDSYQSLWASHGVLAGIAWGVLAPLAIAASLLREWIPPGGLWFRLHMLLNVAVVIMTLASFALAVTAQQKGTPKGQSANHFSTQVTHSTVGLVMVILLTLQAMAGFFRPHLPTTPPENTDEEVAGEDEPVKVEEKSFFRSAWEVLHRLFGFGLLGTSVWQVQEGIHLYAVRFGEKDLSPVYYGVFGGIVGVIAVLWSYSKFQTKGKTAA